VTSVQNALTGVSFTQDLDGRGHLLLADALVLLPLGGRLEALPGQGAQVEVHEDVAQGLQVITPGLLCSRGRREWLRFGFNTSVAAVM